MNFSTSIAIIPMNNRIECLFLILTRPCTRLVETDPEPHKKASPEREHLPGLALYGTEGFSLSRSQISPTASDLRHL